MEKTCKAIDCETKNYCKGYCMKHYYRAKRGNDPNGKTRFDHRPARIDGNIAYLELANGKGEAIVDSYNSSLDEYKWCVSGDGYPMTWDGKRFVKLHHLVAGKPTDGKVTDHINRNRFDARTENLRHVTQRENLLNSTVSQSWVAA